MRYSFGGGISDWAFGSVSVDGTDGLAQIQGGVPVTFWTAETGGSQIVDLLDADGEPTVSVVTSDGTDGRAVGQIPPLLGPDGVTTMWAQAGTGPRALMLTTDAADATVDIGSILPPLSVAGAVSVGAGAHRLYNDTTATLTIAAVRASLGTAGSADTVIDINRNGSTIFPTQTNRLRVLAGQNTSGRIVPTEVTQLSPGDWITVDVDAAGSGAQDLVVQMLTTRG